MKVFEICYNNTSFSQVESGDQMEAYKVKIKVFEGPLDLLLHLIKRYEIDIYDIPMSEITSQYMEYIHTMKELELDIASEYLVMAATLLSIKSKMLLPTPPTDIEFEEYEEEDPREALVEQLIEYKKYKEAAEWLKDKETDMFHVFTKPADDVSYLEKKEDDGCLQVSVYDMLQAVQKLLHRKKFQIPKKATVAREDIPIEGRIEEIRKIFAKKKETTFHQLFDYETKAEIVVTFLAVLELMKLNEIICYQKGTGKEILIHFND